MFKQKISNIDYRSYTEAKIFGQVQDKIVVKVKRRNPAKIDANAFSSKQDIKLIDKLEVPSIPRNKLEMFLYFQ